MNAIHSQFLHFHAIDALMTQLISGQRCNGLLASVVHAILLTMNIALTAVFRKVPEGYIGYVEELPGANTQGSTLDEARDSLLEAVELVLEANRTMAQQDAGQADIREPLQAAHR